MRRLLCSIAAVSSVLLGSAAQAATALQIGYLEHSPERGPVLSNVIPEPTDAGLRGAELAIVDSNSAGKFLGYSYQLDSAISDDTAQLLTEARTLHDKGLRVFVVNAPASTLQTLSQQLPDSLLFNAGSADDALRTHTCLPNVLHTLPSRAMLADALGQFLAARRWNRALLIVGQTEEDRAYAASLRRAAARFGLKIVAEKTWSFDNDQRRSAQTEMPLFTRSDKEYDVVLVADEQGDFGEYVPYHTDLPRPVAGTQGLTPTGWHKTVETYGAAQLQKRFEDSYNRWMNDRDFAAWMAVRSIAAAARLNATTPQAIQHVALSGELPLDGFKGRKLSYRDWSGQLRQPIPVVQPRALVTTSPQEGFLHPVTDLDTLGFDKAESLCNLSAYAPK